MFWTQDYAHQWFDGCRNKQLVGWMTPQFNSSHVDEQAFGNTLQFLDSKIALERPALGVREFHSVCVSNAGKLIPALSVVGGQ